MNVYIAVIKTKSDSWIKSVCCGLLLKKRKSELVSV